MLGCPHVWKGGQALGSLRAGNELGLAWRFVSFFCLDKGLCFGASAILRSVTWWRGWHIFISWCFGDVTDLLDRDEDAYLLSHTWSSIPEQPTNSGRIDCHLTKKRAFQRHHVKLHLWFQGERITPASLIIRRLNERRISGKESGEDSSKKEQGAQRTNYTTCV